MMPAVFLDRDGTIIEDRGHLDSPAQVQFFPETLAALRLLAEQALLFIVTHQSGIAKGLICSEAVAAVNRSLTNTLAAAGIPIRAVYCCPHDRADGCACIKPNPYHLHQAARDHGVDLARSFVIGDHPHDVALGRRAGATGIYVLTGHGQRHRAELPEGEITFPSIAEASRWVLSALAAYTDAAHGPTPLQEEA